MRREVQVLFRFVSRYRAAWHAHLVLAIINRVDSDQQSLYVDTHIQTSGFECSACLFASFDFRGIS